MMGTKRKGEGRSMGTTQEGQNTGTTHEDRKMVGINSDTTINLLSQSTVVTSSTRACPPWLTGVVLVQQRKCWMDNIK